MKLLAQYNQEQRGSLRKETIMRTPKTFTDLILELYPAAKQHDYMTGVTRHYPLDRLTYNVIFMLSSCY